MTIIRLTRQESFCAAHRLHSAGLSEEANKSVYGPCNNPNGHGHNYTGKIDQFTVVYCKVAVTVTGTVDETTGMLMNLTDLGRLLKETVLERLDHRHLDLDLPEHFGPQNPRYIQMAC